MIKEQKGELEDKESRERRKFNEDGKRGMIMEMMIKEQKRMMKRGKGGE